MCRLSYYSLYCHTHAKPCATHILYTQVPEAGSAGTDEDMLNQHVSLLASLAPVVRETIHPDGTRQASYILIALKLIPTLTHLRNQMYPT